MRLRDADERLSQEAEVMVMQPRRLLVFALVAAVAGLIWVRRHAILSRLGASPRLASASGAVSAITTKAPVSLTRPLMVPSVGGNCPETHPVKANPASRIYHLPHQRAYQRLSQAVCFVDASAAETEGYRASKQ